MKEKNIILTARIVSMLFTPFYLPLVGMVALFMFSYMGLLPWSYKLFMLFNVYFFTILLPSVFIHFYRRYQDGLPPSWARRNGASFPISSPSCAISGVSS